MVPDATGGSLAATRRGWAAQVNDPRYERGIDLLKLNGNVSCFVGKGGREARDGVAKAA